MTKLYVVGTPIGNLEDITNRAIRTLAEVDLILCEDTRVTKKLLSRYDIHTKVKRMDAHTENTNIYKVTELFKEYEKIALVSDAGTPTISDPGNRFVKAVREAGILIEVVPGPSAVISALSISGLPSSSFLFLGFLPHKKGRETLFKEIINSRHTVVFYESPHRILKTLKRMTEILEEKRDIVVARELTKIYEESISGTSKEVFEYFNTNEDKQRGEFVVLVGPANSK